MNLEKLRPGDEPYVQMSTLQLRNYMPGEIESLSVLRITNTCSFDSLGHPIAGGLYDTHMGPIEQFDHCATCHLSDLYCPGHVGHIQLRVPLFNPLHYKLLLNILKGTCLFCHRLFLGATTEKAKAFLARLRCIDLGVPELCDKIEATVLEHERGQLRKEFDTPFDDYLDELIAVIANTTVDELRSRAAKIKPHKTLVELKYTLIREFQKLLFRRHRCTACRRPCGTVINDDNRCILIDFHTGADKTRTRKDEDDFEDENVALNDKLVEVTALSADCAATLGTEVLDAQLRSVTEGRTDRLAWRGAEVREHFRLVWRNDGCLLRKVFPMFEDVVATTATGCPLDGLFSEVLLVPPNKFRPIRMLRGDKYEHPQSVALRRVLEADEVIKCLLIFQSTSVAENVRQEMLAFIRKNGVIGKTDSAMMHNAYRNLQNRMNLVYDGEADKTIASTSVVAGIKQILEKKEGLFRKNMMGKRVNYACRSVITPDPYLDVDEIGIPQVFASKLTFSEPVNSFNVRELRRCVTNGPATYPGANFVYMPNGQRRFLPEKQDDTRQALAKQLCIADADAIRPPYKVSRHVKNGDVFIMNRQPSLHKPSMMGHRARVLKGQRALRMNYAPCKAYNADFDGDEMNGHLTQSYQAQVEVSTMMNVGNNFLVPKDASPLLGLIQDHVVSGVLLTIRGRMLNREDFMHLLLAAIGQTKQRLRIVPPCMIKPQKLWSGKQVISAIVLNCIPVGAPLINLNGKAKTAARCWRTREHPSDPNMELSESRVIFRQGELVCGVLDKNHFGASAFGLTHCCFELYGERVGIRILSCLSRLFTTYLQWHGFTLGVADILCLADADRRRHKAVQQTKTMGDEVVIESLGLSTNATHEDVTRAMARTYCGPQGVGADAAALDRGMKKALGPLTKRINECIPMGLVRLFPENSLQLMIESGAKGSTVNGMQISCALGQIELEGKRMALTTAGRTLPSFKAFDTSPRAGGFIGQRFLSGISPQELFFHTMAGREGLIDTAVKTSRSGYLQRCIIKHLEGLRVHYDGTCRDHDGSVIQFRYGEDGMDTCTSAFMCDNKQYEFLRQNIAAVEQNVKPRSRLISTRTLNMRGAVEHFERVREYKTNKLRGRAHRGPNAAFLAFSTTFALGTPKQDMIAAWRELSDKQRHHWRRQSNTVVVDAVDEAFNPARTLGALPEAMLHDIEDFCTAMTARFDRLRQHREKRGEPLLPHELELEQVEILRRTLFWKGMKSLAAPGENVGLLAAQSIGEPSTQMTLNTFHFAGRGEMNVTLGIPRLREILMTSGAVIATPTAQLTLFPGKTPDDLLPLKRDLNCIFLRRVLRCVRVDERINVAESRSWRHYVIRFEVLPAKRREPETQHLTNRQIMLAIEAHSSTSKKQRRSAEIDCVEEDNEHIAHRGFLQTLCGELSQKMESLKKYIAMHATKLRDHKKSMGFDDATGTPAMGQAVDGGDSSDEEADGGKDADAAERRLHQRHQFALLSIRHYFISDDALEYEGEDEERDVVDETDTFDELNERGDDELNDIAALNINDTVVPSAEDEQRITNVLKLSPHIISYTFDTRKNSWCEVTLEMPLVAKTKLDVGTIIQSCLKNFIAHGTPGIEKCVHDQDETGNYVLRTQGVNREALLKYADVLNINSFYSNDLNLMLKFYGVEACAQSIVKEMSSVFGVYGINPSKRHLTLTADYMTFNGYIQPFNRSAMNSSASPLQKMTFETTTEFIRNALIQGETDHLTSPSARIVVGALSKGGTGAFDLFVDPRQLE